VAVGDDGDAHDLGLGSWGLRAWGREFDSLRYDVGQGITGDKTSMDTLKTILENLLEAIPKPSQGQSDRREPVTDRGSAGRIAASPPPPLPRHSRQITTGDAGAGIRAWVNAWQGVPYLMGGTDRSGIDCSGFVREMYKDLFDCPLPRTSREQAQQGAEVSRGELQPGDLVFFQINERTRHVGAYLGSGQFGHASTIKGPMVSRLDSDYWQERYRTARRVL
jgi:cell wall-associated NlpC family hydrolase